MSKNGWKRWLGRYYRDVKRISRRSSTLIEYQDGDKTTIVDSEYGGDGIIIWPERIKIWSSPSGESEITADERAAILTDIEEAFNIPLIVQEWP